MRRVWVIAALITGMGASTAGRKVAAQSPAGNSLLEVTKKADLSTLKICLRLEDETPFLGVATVGVLPEEGYALLGAADETKGDVVFYAVPAGKYVVDVNAPGFRSVRMNTEMETGGRERALFVVLKRRTQGTPEAGAANGAGDPNAEFMPDVKTETMSITKALAHPETKGETRLEASRAKKDGWKPAEWREEGFELDRSVACPKEQVLRSAGVRVKEFIGSMEKFTAMESVEHYSVDKAGERKGRETRKFAYVVVVSRDQNGTFGLEEFRDGNTDQSQFPAKIATMGLPAVVLVFHPDYAEDFAFECDGLARSEGRDYWQMRFAQREDRQVRIESYVVNGASYPVHLQGRAWIDPGKGQVVRLESQLLKPIPQIELWEQHQRIDYTGVRFASTGQEVWLPQAAEVYVERHGKRYYRRHSFEDFRLFNVDTSQNVKAPKGSYSFTNLTDRDMSGELTVMPVEGLQGGPITLRFEVPAHRTVIKTVGPGKDVSLPVASVGSAKFVYRGDAGAVKVDVDLVKETTLDVIPESALATP